MTQTNQTSVAWQIKQRKEFVVKDHTKLGMLLLIPPFLLWVAVITFMLDRTLGEYVFSLFTPNSLDLTFYIAGMIFPGAAIAAAVWGLYTKEDKAPNIAVILFSVLFLTLVAIQMF
jgi:hypothetical protein